MRRFLAVSALTLASCALVPSAASAGVVTCPAGQTYTINPGDPPLELQGGCSGTSLSYSLVSGPSHGSLVGTPAGDATYTPNVGFSGTDQFTYRATDSEGGFAERTVTIIVSSPGPNGVPPSCPDPVHVYVPEGGSTILTGNCSDPDGDSAAIQYGLVSFPANGGLSIVNGTQVQYAPPAGVTFDSFKYSAKDTANNIVEADVFLHVTPPGTTEVSTGTEATSSDPLIAGVETATAVPVGIGARPTSVAPPTGFFLLGTEFNITAPDQTAEDPLRLTFTVDASQVPLSGNVVAFRDGQAIETTCDGSGDAVPDPCVESTTTLANGDVQIVVLSSHASRWNLGYRPRPTNKDQCKGDGWKNYGATYKTQGQCVSAMARAAR